MKKYIYLAREEFGKTVLNAASDPSLPAFVKIDVLKDIITTLEQVAEQEYSIQKEAREKEEADE